MSGRMRVSKVSDELYIECDEVEVNMSCSDRKKKSGKNKGDWTHRKGLSVVRYNPYTDRDFHDVDMGKFHKWMEQHKKEYHDNIAIVRKLEALVQRNERIYNPGDNRFIESQTTNQIIILMHRFHRAVNERYDRMYGDNCAEFDARDKAYEKLRARALAMIANPPDMKKASGFYGLDI